MRPSSVCIPVAKTTPRASPPTQVVPLKTTSRASSSGPWLVAGRRRAEDGLRLAGQRRQVDLERALGAAARRPRPGRPPRASRMSPGTSGARVDTVAAGRRGPPSPAAAGSGASASTARSACRSWRTRTRRSATIDGDDAPPSTGVPARSASAAATHSSSASGCVSWCSSSRGQRRAPPDELVPAVRDEPPVGLAARESAGPSTEVAEQQVDRLLRIRGRRGLDRLVVLDRRHPAEDSVHSPTRHRGRARSTCGISAAPPSPASARKLSRRRHGAVATLATASKIAELPVQTIDEQTGRLLGPARRDPRTNDGATEIDGRRRERAPFDRRVLLNVERPTDEDGVSRRLRRDPCELLAQLAACRAVDGTPAHDLDRGLGSCGLKVHDRPPFAATTRLRVHFRPLATRAHRRSP